MWWKLSKEDNDILFLTVFLPWRASSSFINTDNNLKNIIRNMVAKIIIEMVKIEENHKSENDKLCTDLTTNPFKVKLFLLKILVFAKKQIKIIKRD